MKRIVRIFVLGLMVMAFVTACAPAFTQFVELNNNLKLYIEGGVIFLVGWLFDYLITKIPPLANWLSQYRDVVAIALAGVVVGIAQDLLNLIPPQWEDVGVLAQALLVAVLMAIGLFKALKHNTTSRAFWYY